jgi:8-oxo-dGTP pyrophosphatase MutT (NUDIX family)
VVGRPVRAQRVSDSVRRGGDQVVPRPGVWSAVEHTPWPRDAAHLDVSRIHGAVDAAGRPLQPAFDGARPAAVLVTLAPGDRGPEVLLTRRSMSMRHHRGEISFPGGRMDPGETATETALREAYEEVGLDSNRVRIVGELSHVNTVVSMSYIVPKVAIADERWELAPASGEVDRVMWVPLSELTSPGVYHGERWGAAPSDRLLHFFELADETVWGATAHMLVDLLVRAYR